MAKKAAEVDNMLDLAVSFGNLNVGDKTCRIGCSVARKDLKLTVADKQLCEKRLAGCLISKAGNPDQPTFDGMNDDLEIEGVFDVKGFNVSGEHISFGLTFAIKSIDVAMMAHFAKREGRLMVKSIEEIPEESKADSNGDDSE